LALGFAAYAYAQRGGGAVAGQVVILKDGEPKSDRSNVAVYLKGVPGSDPDKGGTHVIHQKNRSFVPKVSIVTVGTTVKFPNDDLIFHNVFSLSRPARFDLGLYRAGASRSAEMRRPGEVDVYCNIHSEMHAKIKVLDTVHYSVTGKNGRFQIDNVPPGTYELVAWQPWGEDKEKKITIERGRTKQVSFELVERKEDSRHLRKDGTPYGRYK
jgi:plastocyanin